MPLVFLGLANVFGLSSTETLAGLLVTAVPAASNGYVVARTMGGDTELYADILVYQTLLSMAAIPIYASLVL
jgi:predicted permease